MIMTQVCSGLGDLQCSVRAILGFDKKGSQFSDAVINVSTSAQVLRINLRALLLLPLYLLLLATSIAVEPSGEIDVATSRTSLMSVVTKV